MRVEMLDSVSCNNQILRQGLIYDLSSKRASKYIKRGLARSVEDRSMKRPIKRQTTSLEHGDKG